MVAAVVVVIILIVAGLLVYYYYFRPSGSTGPTQAAGFDSGSVVTFQYTGNYSCTPALLTLYPTQHDASNLTGCALVPPGTSPAMSAIPQWFLIPAFGGMSVFGLASQGATSRGFPMFSGSPVLTDCGAGGAPTGCPDTPRYLYAPSFTSIEQSQMISNGISGLPEGVLPMPAHDQLLNVTAPYPSVQWSTVVVFVFDPDIFPSRVTGQCTANVTSNQSTSNCLTSIAALTRAFTTSSSAVPTANAVNPIWKTLANTSSTPDAQVVVVGVMTAGGLSTPDSNLYIPYSVQTGAPSSFPT